MLAELSRALVAEADSFSVERLVVEDNVLGKATMSGRLLSLQRLRELYGLDLNVPLFRILTELWKREPRALPQLALLAALARDPLLRVAARPILALPIGGDLARDEVRDALLSTVGTRLSPATLDKVVRNVASSWFQSGHLKGRTFKKRRRIEATPAALAFALWLAQAAGFVGDALLSNGWVEPLDLDQDGIRALLERVRAAGLVDVRPLGARLEIDASRLLTQAAA
ncbi:hypothetical protein [Aminobacter aminovorans]|uniref:hypothetical protein n=1 Tax=Aminobacter aminovorans TaxID=83263 RepID=UPI0028620087|nr:hypothetical protein [Aminobacter aminovorans]MDR7225208.1 hypothetical protein [Aminobacter aminovorans]